MELAKKESENNNKLVNIEYEADTCDRSKMEKAEQTQDQAWA